MSDNRNFVVALNHIPQKRLRVIGIYNSTQSVICISHTCYSSHPSFKWRWRISSPPPRLIHRQVLSRTSYCSSPASSKCALTNHNRIPARHNLLAFNSLTNYFVEWIYEKLNLCCKLCINNKNNPRRCKCEKSIEGEDLRGVRVAGNSISRCRHGKTLSWNARDFLLHLELHFSRAVNDRLT